MKSICFVCLGNICRSPMAEFVMKKLVNNYDYAIAVESRATSSWEHGNPIHRGTQKMLRKYNVPYDKKKGSQQISFDELSQFDLIIGMDEDNVIDLKALSHGIYDDKIFIFRKGGVPDPWYTGDFESTYNLVKEGCRKWLARLLSQNEEKDN